MWRLEPTRGWQLSALEISQANPQEMASLLRNLTHYHAQLNESKSHKSVEASYLHSEGQSIVALDQTGMEDGLQNMRLYIFPDEAKRILYLLCVGLASDKATDMEHCKTVVLSIVNERS